MYDQEARKWRSDCESEELLRWCREPANSAKPEACFLQASHLLAQGDQGEHLSEAMALLEKAGEYPPALCAMGQLYQWGWGIHKDRKQALEWYRRAAALGSQPAKEYFARLRKRRLVTAASLLASAVCIAMVIALPVLMVQTARRIIKVHPDSRLVETITGEEYRQEIRDLIAQYDTDEMRAGQACTNRVVLQFEGNRLDLRSYPADEVIAMEDNRVVLQFTEESEALRCIEELSKLESVLYAEMDEYDIGTNAKPRADGTGQQNGHYSWGVVDLGLDQLSSYVAEKYNGQELIVAVLDQGVKPWPRNLPRLLEGQNMVTGDIGTSQPGSHGTHVAGTVLDGTKGTGVVILPVDVFNEGGPEGRGSMLTVISGIDYAVEQGASVINMSLGLSARGHHKSTEYAVRRAVKAGVVVVIAAGNDTDDTAENCPCCVEEAIVVGAYDIQRKIAYFSNYGSSVDVCAPGVEILSDNYEKEDVLLSLQGTSMAAPHITALAALMRILYPNASPAQIEQYLKDYCTALWDQENYGSGLPNATAFMEY